MGGYAGVLAHIRGDPLALLLFVVAFVVGGILAVPLGVLGRVTIGSPRTFREWGVLWAFCSMGLLYLAMRLIT